jgi:hypothetical protein
MAIEVTAEVTLSAEEIRIVRSALSAYESKIMQDIDDSAKLKDSVYKHSKVDNLLMQFHGSKCLKSKCNEALNNLCDWR